MTKSTYIMDNNYAVVIEEDERPWNNLNDFSDWLDCGVSHNGFSGVNISENIFSSPSTLYQNLCLVMEEGYEAVGSGFAEAVKDWQRAKEDLKSCFTFETEIDFNQIVSEKIYPQHWKPLVDSHIEYIKQCDKGDFIEHFKNIDASLYLKELTLFKQQNLSQLITVFLEEEKPHKKDFNKLKSVYCEVISKFEVKTVEDLDNLLDYFLRAYYDVINFENTFMLPDPDFSTRLQNSLADIYVEHNPYVEWGRVSDGYHGFSLDTENNFDRSNCLIISDKAKGYQNILSGVNQFLTGEWYYGSVYYIIPESELYKYAEDAEYNADLEAQVIDMADSCGCFETEEAVKEHFEGWIKSTPPKYKLNYRKLGTIPCLNTKS